MVERRRAAFSPTMKPVLQVGIAIFIWSAALISAEQPRPPDCGSPIWSTEVLVELGRGRSDVTRFPDTGRAGVVFTSDSHLIVYEVGHDVGQPSAHTTAEILRPFVLRLQLLDSASGKVTLRTEEKTRAQDTAVFATAAGLLVKTGSLMKLLSADLAQDRDVSFAIDRNSGVRVTVSASGKTIMLNDVIQDSLNHFHSHFTVLDAAMAKVRYSWNESPPLYHHYSISDEGIAAVNLVGNFIAVAGFGTSKWTRIGEPVGLCASMNMPTLYSDQQFVYGCDKLIAMSIDGHVLMTDSFPSGDASSDMTTVAQDGRFVAVSLNTIEVKKHFLAEPSVRVTATHIVVYDLTLKKQILTVNVNPLPKNDYDLALSPDGSKLAILNDRKVSVCAVPVQSTDHAELYSGTP
jgi:hypothetical protein